MNARARRRGNWSVQELTRLRQLLPCRGVEATATLLRRSAESVRRKAMDLLRVPLRKTPWTLADDAQLRESYGVLDARLLAAILGRATVEVQRRAEQLREQLHSGPWERDELVRLRRLYGTRSDADLEVCLQRPRADIAEQARRRCLAKDKRFAHELAQKQLAPRQRMPRWQPGEIELLRQLYPDSPNLTVAQRLARTVTSVANKAHQLGLQKSPEFLARQGRDNVAARWGSVVPPAAAAPAPEPAPENAADGAGS